MITFISNEKLCIVSGYDIPYPAGVRQVSQPNFITFRLLRSFQSWLRPGAFSGSGQFYRYRIRDKSISTAIKIIIHMLLFSSEYLTVRLPRVHPRYAMWRSASVGIVIGANQQSI